jgi:hypothetical protein
MRNVLTIEGAGLPVRYLADRLVVRRDVAVRVIGESFEGQGGEGDQR